MLSNQWEPLDELDYGADQVNSANDRASRREEKCAHRVDNYLCRERHEPGKFEIAEQVNQSSDRKRGRSQGIDQVL